MLSTVQTLHKSFPLKISSVNVTKSTGHWGFGHIYWRIPKWKTSFFARYKQEIHWKASKEMNIKWSHWFTLHKLAHLKKCNSFRSNLNLFFVILTYLLLMFHIYTLWKSQKKIGRKFKKVNWRSFCPFCQFSMNM